MNVIDLKNLNNSPSVKPPIELPPDPQRRQLLRIVLVGIGAFVLGFLTKSLGLSGLFSKTRTIQTPSGSDSELQTDDLDYKIVKNKNQTIFIDKKTNEEVLILD